MDSRTVMQTCHMQRARKEARRLTAHYEACFKPLGLTAGQFSTLVALDQKQAFQLSELADALGMNPSTLSRNIKPLERRGLVTRVVGEDSRSRQLSLSDTGRARLAKALPLWAEAQAAAVRSGPPD